MALVICPECNEEISEFAENCPKCGFPLNDFMKQNNLIDTSKQFLCPRCGFFNEWDDGIDNSIYLKCKYCNTTMVQSNETPEEVVDNFVKNAAYGDYRKTLAVKIGQEKFSEEAFQQRENILNKKRNCNQQSKKQSVQPKSSPQVTCPYCHSTNTKKISAGSRVKSTLMFGIFSKKNGKEWHCNECGSDF